MFVFSLPAYAQQKFEFDVAASVGSITFVPPQIKAGESLRIYGTIVNVGEKDLTGHVGFYQGTFLIGEPQPFSLKANGVPEEVWVDWIPPEGTYNIMMTILQTKPEDQNPSNNVSLTPLLTVRKPIAPPVAPLKQVPLPSTISAVEPVPSSVSEPSVPTVKIEKVQPTTVSTPPIRQSSPIKAPTNASSTIKEPTDTKQEQLSKTQAIREVPIAEATSTNSMATTTEPTQLLVQQYSEQLKKSAQERIESFADENPAEEVAPQNNGTVSDEGLSSGFIMIGSSAAVAFLLIGLLFFKRSGIL